MVLRVGLTGGIGSGKSEVSRRLAALGAVILDADKAAREVVAPGTPGLAAVAETFGPGVLLSDGSLDRARLAGIVFADDEARGRLNAIVHPLVQEWMRAAEAAVVAAGDGAVIVHDVPLLAEGGRSGDFDLVIVVDTPPEVQTERLVWQRGMTADQARARIAAQATRQQRLAVADIVIDNSGPLADLDNRVKEVWTALRARALRRLRHSGQMPRRVPDSFRVSVAVAALTRNKSATLERRSRRGMSDPRHTVEIVSRCEEEVVPCAQ